MCNCHDHNHDPKLTRRQALTGTVALAAAATGLAATGAKAQDNPYAEPAEPALPPSDMKIDPARVALVVTDPQNDFLSPNGVTWGVVGASVERNNTVANIESLFKAANASGITF
ncbi:MAG: isochorismatase, partial [Roseovarius sp.]|nr:isochorismatase [Roseovarius sp.]